MDIYAYTLGLSWTTYSLTVVLLMITYSYISRKPWINLPPGPPAVPVLGSLPFMPSADLRKTYRQFRQKYGDIFTVHIGAETFVVLNGIDLINEIYVKRGHLFAARPDNYFVQRFFGKSGILGSSGEHWKTNRLLTMKYMKALGYGSIKMEEIILAQVDELLDEFKNLCDNNTPTCVLPIFMKTAYKAVSDLALGRVLDKSDPKLPEFLKMIRHTLAVFNNLFSFYPYLRFLPGDYFGLKNDRRIFNVFLEQCKAVMNDRKRDLLNGAGQTDEPYDVIGMYYYDMAKTGRNEGVISEHDMAHTMTALYLGGTDTVAVILTWVVLFMVLHPDVQEKVYAEISDVIGSGRPKLGDNLRMPYTSAVISETQRLSDSVPIPLPHAPLEETTLAGYTIPKGMPIISNFNSLCMDPIVWPEPSVFKPERFLDDAGSYTAKREHYPFGKGPRNCVGEAMAKAELFLIFVSVIQRFRLSLPEGAPPPSIETDYGHIVGPRHFEIIINERA